MVYLRSPRAFWEYENIAFYFGEQGNVDLVLWNSSFKKYILGNIQK